MCRDTSRRSRPFGRPPLQSLRATTETRLTVSSRSSPAVWSCCADPALVVGGHAAARAAAARIFLTPSWLTCTPSAVILPAVGRGGAPPPRHPPPPPPARRCLGGTHQPPPPPPRPPEGGVPPPE